MLVRTLSCIRQSFVKLSFFVGLFEFCKYLIGKFKGRVAFNYFPVDESNECDVLSLSRYFYCIVRTPALLSISIVCDHPRLPCPLNHILFDLSSFDLVFIRDEELGRMGICYKPDF